VQKYLSVTNHTATIFWFSCEPGRVERVTLSDAGHRSQICRARRWKTEFGATGWDLLEKTSGKLV